MRTAKAAVYEAPNTPFVLKEFPVRPARRGEVLVRVTMSTICRSDIHSYEGRRPSPCPGILGHEIIGIIEEIGEGIDRDMRGDPLKVGDRITWSEYFFDGQCYYREVLDLPQKCHGVRKYGHDLAEQDPHFLGGFAEYCYILPGTWILRLPDDLSDEEATPLNCGVATMASVTEAAEIALGDAVVIQGLGLLGLYGAAMAKARGARCVIGLDAVASRLNAAKKTISESPVSPEALAQLVGLIQKGTITGKSAKDVFSEMFETGSSAEQIVKAKGLTAVGDEGAITKWCEEAIQEMPKAVEEYRAGKERAIGSLVGLVMKKSQGKANPQMVNRILQNKLKN